jgi:hypothetical protein
MLYKFLWCPPDHLAVWSGVVRGNHHLTKVKEWMDEGIFDPANYAGGDYAQDTFNEENPALDRIKVYYSEGQHPTDDQLKYMCRQYLDVDRESRYQARTLYDRMSATVEDTEPEYNFGFMKEPHEKLYPCAWSDDNQMKPKANKAIKNHALNALSDAGYPDADTWIAFSVYGSGASYNWDEDGDFDVQMWLDAEKYNSGHEPKDADDLLADVRRAVQTVNFPSFEELGLATPDCEGRMLIQYYPKPGTGSKDENLASKPYACYNLDNDEWFQRPEKIEPTFYGEQFLLVMPKAQDIAVQTEALLGELERNSVNWQFWSQMFDKWGDKRYEEQAEDAKSKATDEREGVKVLFQGVFGGRQQAYSPEGKGIKDERDIIQKLLEVWGVFQRLKHFSRQPLPWEEQELPEEVEDDKKDSGESRDDTGNNPVSPSKSSVVSSSVISHKLRIAESEQESKPPLSEAANGWIYDPNTDKLYVGGWHGQLLTDHFADNYWEGDWPENLVFGWFSRNYGSEDERTPVVIQSDNFTSTVTPEQQSRAFEKAQEYYEKYHDTPYDQLPSTLEAKTANWSEIMQKAQRLKNNGQVFINFNGQQHVEGQVVGDTGTYDTSFDRMDPNSQAITTWNCSCPWGEVSWGRTRQWKKYEGRPCAHTLAMFWASRSQPTAEEGQGQLFQQTPQTTLPAPAPGGPNLPQPVPQAPVGPQPIPAVNPSVAPPPPAPPASSRPTQPGEGGQLGIPGALSKLKVANPDKLDQIKEVAEKHRPSAAPDYGHVWYDTATKTVFWQAADWTSNEEIEAAQRDFEAIDGVDKVEIEAEAQPTSWMRLASFQNGQLVQARSPMWGIDRDERAQMVPAGSKGEVLFSNENETIAIFPLDSGQLEPHLVRVQSDTENFRPAKGKTPFVGTK